MLWMSIFASIARRSNVKVCFDAFALLSWLQREPGAVRVRDFLLEAAGHPDSTVYMSVVNLGEVRTEA